MSYRKFDRRAFVAWLSAAPLGLALLSAGKRLGQRISRVRPRRKVAGAAVSCGYMSSVDLRRFYTKHEQGAGRS